ncbi:hypothetical protein bAD24_I06660 [Burkholderia sp. AD24]|uniref:Uncharacterized protein n=1 Tax=Paraburkholderia bryophila TaxID=420952 RepID=A0A329CQ42_9BURK|nr:hypothetical protein bAD24_I06660 [Burkholderia sp. AD24]RAS35912.1 hypothetical protein BX591_104242 [Paraburkholderia bryophila]
MEFNAQLKGFSFPDGLQGLPGVTVKATRNDP